MDDVADVGDADDQSQLADDLRAVDGNNGGHQAENADRGEADDHHHDLHNDFEAAVDQLADLRALFAGGQNARAKEDGNDDNRQHVGIDHGLEEVVGEDVHDDLHDMGRFLGLIFQRTEVGGGQGRERALEQVDQHKADHDGDGGGTHVVDKSFQADRADALEIVQGDNAVCDRQQNHRNNQELQQVDIDRADGLDPCGGKITLSGKRERKARRDTGKHADKYPCRQTQFLLFFHKSFHLIKSLIPVKLSPSTVRLL